GCTELERFGSPSPTLGGSRTSRGCSSQRGSAVTPSRRPSGDSTRRGAPGRCSRPCAGRSQGPSRPPSWHTGSPPGLSAQRRGFFYDLLGGAQDVDLHSLASERALEVSNLGVRLPQLAGGHNILTRLDCRGRARLREPLPVADDTGRDVELATEFRQRLLAR